MTSQQSDLFGAVKEAPKKNQDYKIIPVSVIDIEAQKKRQNEDHAKTSSRANYSPFPSEVSDLCYEYYLRDSKIIADPFAGWGERHSKALEYNKQYFGFDTSELAIAKAKKEFSVSNILADSRTVELPSFDGLITCPPYWNLEKYAAEIGVDRCKTWLEFKDNLELIFKRFYLAADGGATFCVMVGDWRKNHIYYDLEYVINGIFDRLGAQVFDKVVVSRKKISKIKIMLPQAKRLGYSVRVHENLLIFKKPIA